jgi:hypothetical protein
MNRFLLTSAFCIGAFVPLFAGAATLSIEPASGTFVVGSTFNASVFLNTEDEAINAVDVNISFPPDKLQVVSASTGFSIIKTWVANPDYDNREGKIDFQGGIPSGIYAQKGLISTVTFRVKSVGSALVRILDTSDVLLHDGKGTSALKDSSNGLYNLILPPPAGPVVVSETHPDQQKWYSSSNVVLKWSNLEEVEGYSYVLNDEPTEIPDNISEGIKENVIYKELSSGNHYFHIKALRNGVWGGVTHFALNIDSEPPAGFVVEISPSRITTEKNPIVRFETTDALSGIRHYEYKIINLNPVAVAAAGNQNFFIEFNGQQVLSLDRGKYDIIGRAYDNAGNIREATERLEIVTPVGKVLKSGWVWAGGLVLLVILGAGSYFSHRWHNEINKKKKRKIPPHVKEKLEELKKYRKKYGKLAVLLLLAGSLGLALVGPVNVFAEEEMQVSPPYITTVSRNISNEDIFYIGGKTDAAETEVVIYLQNLETGETQSQRVVSNKKRDWFYRHPTFLSTGNYLLWAQSRLGEAQSPPSPQFEMKVTPTAIQFGSSRFSFETIYLIFAIVLLIAVIGLSVFIAAHSSEARRKHKEFMKELREAEESVRRGFAVIRRDVELELAALKRAKPKSQAAMKEAKEKEEELMRDLRSIESQIGKEIWDIERTEGK